MGSNVSGALFVPASRDDFARRAKGLSHLLGIPLQRAQEALARVYGHADAHALRAVIANGSPPGPFDDELPWGGISSGRRNRFIEILLAHAGLPDHETYKIYVAEEADFFADWDQHKHRRETASLDLQYGELHFDGGDGLCARDYAAAFDTEGGSGEWTFALTRQGRAVRNVLSRWFDQQEGHRPVDFNSHLDRLYELVEQHPNCAWASASLASFLYFDTNADLNRSMDSYDDAIEIFESILNPVQVIEYAGAKLGYGATGCLGFGNESAFFPSALASGGDNAFELDDIDKAITLYERALTTDTRDGHGARFSLMECYGRAARRQAYGETTALIAGHFLRALRHVELGDTSKGIRALAVTVVQCASMCVNGYRAPATIAGLMSNARPIGRHHQSAYDFLALVAGNSDVAKVANFYLKVTRGGPIWADSDLSFISSAFAVARDGGGTSPAAWDAWIVEASHIRSALSGR
jgi:tetratricopeptide (TPR) repeat protein